MDRSAVDTDIASAHGANLAAVKLELEDSFEDASVAECECAMRGRGDVRGKVDDAYEGAVGRHETGLCRRLIHAC